MQAAGAKTSMFDQWWRLAGVAGIVWIVLFIVGGIGIQGDTPDTTQTVAEMRDYFSTDSGSYLVGDFITTIAFVFFFLPFIIGLRWVLGSVEDGPPILSWIMVGAAFVATALAGAASAFEGGAALAFKNNIQMDDSTLQTLVYLDAFGFTAAQTVAALMLFAAGALVLRTGVVWRWTGIIAIVAAVLMLVGSAWPIDGDGDGPLAVAGFIGFPLWGLWGLTTSIALIMRKGPPPSTERAMAPR
jgi:hypothetical protein